MKAIGFGVDITLDYLILSVDRAEITASSEIRSLRIHHAKSGPCARLEYFITIHVMHANWDA